MLTMILKILGILGILLLVLLGVVVTILLLVLFLPVVYSVRADRRAVCEGEPLQDETEVLPEEYLLRVAAKADWLLGFLRVRFFYPEPGTVTVKVLFFKIFDSGKEAEEEERQTDRSEAAKSKKSKSKKDAPAKSKEPASGTDEAKTVESKTVEGKWAEGKTAEPTNSESPKEESAQQKENNPKRNAFEKIQYTFRKICDRIKEIYGKIQEARNHIEYYKEILLSEDAKGLLNHAFMRLGRILKSIRPRKLRADIRFGTGAPDTTGYVFGIYGILCSYLGKNVILTPDFDKAVLTGELYAAGHITVFKLLWHFLWIVLDKRLWKLYSKLKEG